MIEEEFTYERIKKAYDQLEDKKVMEDLLATYVSYASTSNDDPFSRVYFEICNKGENND